MTGAIQQKASHHVAVFCLKAIQVGVHVIECPQLMLPEAKLIAIGLMAFRFQLNQALERCTPALSVTEQIVGDHQDTVLNLGRKVERMPPLGQHLATIVRQVAERGHWAAAALCNRFNALNPPVPE